MGDRLRAALASGDFAGLADLYSTDSLLDLSLPGGRRRVAGPDRAVELLCRQFPELVEWSPPMNPAGIACWFERVPDGGRPFASVSICSSATA